MLICLICQEGTLEDFIAAEPKHPHIVVTGDPYGDYTCQTLLFAVLLLSQNQ